MPKRNRAHKHARQSSLESLESRRLLSASLSHGLLTIDGTRRADQITAGLVSPRTLRVTVNGEESLFDRKGVEKIRVRAGTGDDSFVFETNAAYPTTLRLLVSGGAGNDSLYGGDNADTLLGDDGNDFFESWGGNDVIRGGAGNDTLRGRDGDDRLFGESGDDELRGMTGDDMLFGGRGDDTLHEDTGRDRVVGGEGVDHFYVFESPKDIRDESRREAIDPEPVVSMPMGFIPGQVLTVQHANLIDFTKYTSLSGVNSTVYNAYNLGSSAINTAGIIKSGSGGLTMSGGSVSAELHRHPSSKPLDLTGVTAHSNPPASGTLHLFSAGFGGVSLT